MRRTTMTVRLLESQMSVSKLTQLRHLLDGFIEDKLAINTHSNTPLRQMDRTSDREGGWHDLVASLAERYASGPSKAIQPHIVKDNCRNERLLDPSLVSSIENITHL